jgi:integrase
MSMSNGRRRRQLTPEEKWEVFLEVTSQQLTQRDAARKWGVDVSVIIKLRKLAKDAALAAFASSKPGRLATPQEVEIQALQAENARLPEALKELAVELTLVRGKAPFAPRRQLAVLLGAFAGLSTAEACGLRVEDVAFLEREIRPVVQWPAEPLKTDMRYTPVPVADTLLEAISAQVATYPSSWVLSDDEGGQLRPRRIQTEIERTRGAVDGLPEGFRYHDLRHYFASLLIASGADVKIVQARLRHSSATTTLNVYSHLWPDSDESTRTAVERVMSERLADSLRTGAVSEAR